MAVAGNNEDCITYFMFFLVQWETKKNEFLETKKNAKLCKIFWVFDSFQLLSKINFQELFEWNMQRPISIKKETYKITFFRIYFPNSFFSSSINRSSSSFPCKNVTSFINGSFHTKFKWLCLYKLNYSYKLYSLEHIYRLFAMPSST